MPGFEPNAAEIALGETMPRYLTAFAATDDPNYVGAPLSWPRTTATVTSTCASTRPSPQALTSTTPHATSGIRTCHRLAGPLSAEASTPKPLGRDWDNERPRLAPRIV
jgi:hypothetical protein